MKSTMMKTFFAATAALLLFSACNEKPAPQAASKSQASDTTAEATSSGLNVAFIYGDSVNVRYQFLIDAEKELEREGKLIDERIRRKYERAEKRAAELQREAPSMGQLEMQEAQIEMQNLQVEMQEFQEKLARDFRKREVELQTNYLARINTFLEGYNSDGRYDMIMNFQPGGNLLWMSDAFDITDEVVEGLNAEYDAEMAAKKAEDKK
ncbi:MAG: OmpH family outer membrane protein [Cryomorphaceae bacterium]